MLALLSIIFTLDMSRFLLVLNVVISMVWCSVWLVGINSMKGVNRASFAAMVKASSLKVICLWLKYCFD